jgi:hypothetical protein
MCSSPLASLLTPPLSPLLSPVLPPFLHEPASLQVYKHTSLSSSDWPTLHALKLVIAFEPYSIPAMESIERMDGFHKSVKLDWAPVRCPY